MMMETLKSDKRFQLHIIGHSGDSEKIPLVNPKTNLDEKTQLQVLECMVANTQYTFAGDNTIDAISSVVEEAGQGDLIIVISDANLDRYKITVDDLNPLQSKKVHARKSGRNELFLLDISTFISSMSLCYTLFLFRLDIHWISS